MYFPPSTDINALLSPTLAMYTTSSIKNCIKNYNIPTNKLVIAHEPLLSSILMFPPEYFSTASRKYVSAFLNPLIMA